MGSFDILPLFAVEPAIRLCPVCVAILIDDPDIELSQTVGCPLCEGNAVELTPTEQARKSTHISPADFLEHARLLAEVAYWVEENGPSISLLLEAVSRSRWFIHFSASYTISHQFIGALKLASHEVSVRGIVGGADSSMIHELQTEARDGGDLYGGPRPEFTVRTVPAVSNGKDHQIVPHQKLIIFDGLLAFKGSANLTVSGWRKAATDMEIVETVSEISEVALLNNKYFSPTWFALA